MAQIRATILPKNHADLFGHLVSSHVRHSAHATGNVNIYPLQLSALPVEILEQHIILSFLCPRDAAQVLATSSRLRSFRPSCVNGFLEKLFQGKPGAVNAVSWVRSHHSEILDDVSLVDWLYGIMEKAKAGAYRASIGSAHTVVLTPSGRVLAAGNGKYGVLGARSNMNSFLFTEVDMHWGRFPGGIPVEAVACGHHHSLFLTAVGTVHSCGLGDYGRLGHGNEQSLSRPTLIDSLMGERITQIAAGVANSVAVSWTGDVFTWGWGFGNTLGHDDEADRLVPTRPCRLPDDHASDSSHRPDPGEVGASSGKHAGLGGGVHTAPFSSRGASRPSRSDPIGRRERGAGDAFRDMDKVTCAAAGTSCTVLGTMSGKVFFAGTHAQHGAPTSGRFTEFGHLPYGSSCWRVQHGMIREGAEDMVLVIDESGRVHALTRMGSSPQAMLVSVERRTMGCEDGDGDADRRMSMGAGNVGDHTPGTQGRMMFQARSSSSASTCSVHATPTRSTPCPPSPATKCSTALVSPRRGTNVGDGGILDHCSFIPHGYVGWDTQDSFVVITTDGALVSSNGVGPGHDVRAIVESGVVCAAAFLAKDAIESYGLVVIDHGNSLLTWGDGRSGHLGHGTLGYKHSPQVVTSARILGDVNPEKRGTRHPNLQVSVDRDTINTIAASRKRITEKRRAAGGTELGRVVPGLLGLVDAVADERDLNDEL